jgi:membrane fusion protein (multidrug efflux system)
MKRLSVALVLITLASLGCNTAVPDKTQGQQASQQPSPKAPTAVSTVAVVSRKLSTTVSLPAQLIPYESVDIFPKVTGFVQRITVDRGSRVRRGQLLVLLTAPELISQRAQAESAVKAAQSQLATAEAKLVSDNGTYLHMVSASKTPGVIAENDLMISDQTVSADKGMVAAAEQNVGSAREALRTVSQTESYLIITAPFNGVVTTRNLHPGALIGPASGQAAAQPILRIVDDTRLRLVAPVPEAEAGAMRVGQMVSFNVPGYPAQSFKAPIKRISHEIDAKTRTMPVELDVANKDGKLSPGSFSNVQWPVNRNYPTLFVPVSAVTSDQQHTFVIRVHNNKAEWVTVQTGQTVEGQIEVFGELQSGDPVVKTATDAIHSGDQVQVQTAKP